MEKIINDGWYHISQKVPHKGDLILVTSAKGKSYSVVMYIDKDILTDGNVEFWMPCPKLFKEEHEKKDEQCSNCLENVLKDECNKSGLNFNIIEDFFNFIANILLTSRDEKNTKTNASVILKLAQKYNEITNQ